MDPRISSRDSVHGALLDISQFQDDINARILKVYQPESEEQTEVMQRDSTLSTPTSQAETVWQGVQPPYGLRFAEGNGILRTKRAQQLQTSVLAMQSAGQIMTENSNLARLTYRAFRGRCVATCFLWRSDCRWPSAPLDFHALRIEGQSGCFVVRARYIHKRPRFGGGQFTPNTR